MPDKSAENLARIRACDADWNENDHPRADNGQFTSGSGGGGAKVSKLQSGGKAKVQQLKNVSGALAGVNAGIEKADNTFAARMDRTRKAGAAKHKDLEQREDAVRKKYEGDWRYGSMYGKLKNKPGMERLAERVKNKAKSREAQKRDELAGLEKEYHQIQNEYDPIVGERQRAANKQYEKTMRQLYPQKQALEAEQKKFQGAKKTLEKAKPGIRQMKAEKLGYNKLTGEKASNHPEGEAHNMMVGAMESAGGDFYAAKNRLLNNPGTSEKVRAALKKMKAPAGSKPASMDGLVQKYIDDGDNERAATAIELRSEMKMGNDIHQAVHNLLSKYDEAVDNGWIDRDSYDKNVDMLLNDVSGAAWDVLNPPKPKTAAPAAKPAAPANKNSKGYKDGEKSVLKTLFNTRDKDKIRSAMQDYLSDAQKDVDEWSEKLKQNPNDKTAQHMLDFSQGIFDTWQRRLSYLK
jgi:hypothetical protein